MTKMKPLYVGFCLVTWDKKHHIFGSLVNPKMSSVLLYHYLKRNGTERDWMERNGLELKARLLNFVGT